MCSWKRISIVLLAGCLIAVSPGLAGEATLAQLKQRAVESALVSYETGNAGAIIQSAATAHAVRAISYDSASSALSVEVDGTPDVDWIFIKSSNRLAIDFNDAVNLVAGRPVDVAAGSAVESIRTSIYKLEPRIVSRIVLQLTGPVEVSLDDSDPGLLVFSFSGGVPTTPAEENAGAPDPAPVLNDKDAIVAMIESELDGQVSRPDAARTAVVSLFAETREQIASQQELLKAEAAAKAYPADLGYLVVLADHEKSLGGHLTELASERELIVERVEMARGEMATVLKSDYEPQALNDELNKILAKVREDGSLDAGRLDQIQQIASDEQRIALAGMDTLARKITAAPGAPGAPIEVATARDKDVAVHAETEFIVADAPSIDETVEHIDALMEEALADESISTDTESQIIAGEAEITVADADTEDALVALQELSSEMSRLRSHPSASDEMPLLAMLPGNVTVTATSAFQSDNLEQTKPAPVELENGAPTLMYAAAGDSSKPSAVSGPEVDSPVGEAPDSATAEVADSDTAEASAVPVTDARTATNDPGAVAARAQDSTRTGNAPQVMAQATAGQPEVLTSDDLGAPPARPTYSGDPMDQPVSIEFREELLRNIIGLLAQKAGVNVIGGGTLGDVTVSANMRDVPLRQAMNMLLRLENFGMVEEEGVYRIVPYEVAVQLRRVTRMVPLRNAQAKEVEQTLTTITSGSAVDQQVMVASNQTANVIVLSGPLDRVEELEQLVLNLDIAEPTLPTITEAIRLNYAEPEEVRTIVESLLTVDNETQIGRVEADVRGRSVVVTDLPIVVEQVRALIQEIDYPVQQVNIDSMVVDVTLTDDAATGVDWFVNLLRKTNSNGELIGNLSNLQVASDFGGAGNLTGPIPSPGQVIFPLGGNQNPVSPLGSGVLQFGILSSDFDIQGLISAEVNNNNAEILANPKLVTLENQPAQIEIIQEFPYRELTQTEGGGQIASTEFKNIGTTLEVTPRVTADEDILVNMFVEQSVIVGFSQGDNIPITNNRRATTNVRTADRQTIFIGGLRRLDDQIDIRKIPVLGDLPIISPLFRTTTASKQNTDLLIFVTCDVLGERAPDLTGTQQKDFDRLGAKPEIPDAQREVLRTWAKPNEMRDPIWKWRRSK